MSLREDAQAILSQFLEFVVDLLKGFLHANSFYLMFIALEIQMKFIMSSNSLELETSFDSDNSERNFIALSK